MKDIIIGLLFFIAIVGTWFGIIFAAVVYKENHPEPISQVTQCEKIHGKEILEYIPKCVESLRVEENAYVIDTCESLAVKYICNI